LKKKIFAVLMAVLMAGMLLTGCTNNNKTETSTKTSVEKDSGEDAEASESEPVLEDGTYTAEFNTDSSMFRVNETCDGKGTLTVKDGKMTMHVTLLSKNIVHLFVGTTDDAKKDGADLLEPTIDTVTYADGTTEEVHGFDIPISVINEKFDLALIGTKGVWYDHKVSVDNPEKVE
jgi:major membrane immunogen (membrane-anchored lipoprotein)